MYSLVIRSFNEEVHIGKLMVGVRYQSEKDIEIILVDSGSTDRTVDIAASYGARILHVAKEEFSFGRALNLGCEAANGEILIFVSAHVYPLRVDWLTELVAPFEQPKVVLSYGRQVGNEVTKFSEHQIFASWFPNESIAHQAHNFCNNANCAVRKSIWKEIPYDEELTGLEDLAWAKEARRQGGQVAYAAKAVIVHVHEETWARVRNRYRREAMALKHIEPKIRFHFGSFARLTATAILSDSIAAYQQGVLYSEWLNIVLFRYNQFYATWRGHQSHRKLNGVLRNRLYYPAMIGRVKPPAAADPAIIEYGNSRIRSDDHS